jgi:hypothetical protein
MSRAFLATFAGLDPTFPLSHDQRASSLCVYKLKRRPLPYQASLHRYFPNHHLEAVALEEDDVIDCEVDYTCHKSPLKATRHILKCLSIFHKSTETTMTTKLVRQSAEHHLKKFLVEDKQSTPTIGDKVCHCPHLRSPL